MLSDALQNICLLDYPHLPFTFCLSQEHSCFPLSGSSVQHAFIPTDSCTQCTQMICARIVNLDEVQADTSSQVFCSRFLQPGKSPSAFFSVLTSESVTVMCFTSNIFTISILSPVTNTQVKWTLLVWCFYDIGACFLEKYLFGIYSLRFYELKATPIDYFLMNYQSFL